MRHGQTALFHVHRFVSFGSKAGDLQKLGITQPFAFLSRRRARKVGYLTRAKLNSNAPLPNSAIIAYSKPCAPMPLPLRNTSRITTR